MRKIALTLFVTGITMTACGAEVDDKPYRAGSRQPLAPLSGHSNTSTEELYPECSLFIRAEREKAHEKGVVKGREEGREEGERKAKLEMALKMFNKTKTYTDEIMDYTGITEEQLKEVLAAEKGQ